MDGRTDGHEEASRYAKAPKKDAKILLGLFVFSHCFHPSHSRPIRKKKLAYKSRFLNLIINPFVAILGQSSECLNVGENMRSENVAGIGYMRNTKYQLKSGRKNSKKARVK
jgi:hypothetical protein